MVMTHTRKLGPAIRNPQWSDATWQCGQWLIWKRSPRDARRRYMARYLPWAFEFKQQIEADGLRDLVRLILNKEAQS